MTVDVSPGVALNGEMLNATVKQARDDWARMGTGFALPADLRFAIADLPGNTLGQAFGRGVTMDVDAAGRGWSMGAARGFDLVDAVAHEPGHYFGSDDLDGDEHRHEVMSGTRTPGMKRPFNPVPAVPINLPAGSPSRPDPAAATPPAASGGPRSLVGSARQFPTSPRPRRITFLSRPADRDDTTRPNPVVIDAILAQGSPDGTAPRPSDLRGRLFRRGFNR